MAEESARKVINDLWCKYFNSFHRVDDSTKSVEGECTNFLEWYSSRTDLLLKEFSSLADTLRLMLLIDEENQLVGGFIDSKEHMTEEEKSYISSKHSSVAEENSDDNDEEDMGEDDEEDDESEDDCSESDSEEHGGELEEHYYEPLNEILYKILPMASVFGDEEDKEVYRSMLDAYFRECLKNEWI